MNAASDLQSGRVTRVLLVDDHPLVREALARRLGQEPGFEIVGEACDADEAIGLLQTLRPEVLILDLGLPGARDGLALIEQINGHAWTPKIVVLTGHATLFHAIRCYRAGANAFISKSAQTNELLEAITTAAEGRRYVPPELAADVADHFLENRGVAVDPFDSLTNRELQILRALAAGETNREIAERLNISVRTVDTHRGNLLRKLGLRNNSDLTRTAIRWGLL